MANVFISENTLESFGDLIREKKGNTDKVPTVNMVSELRALIENGSDESGIDIAALLDRSIVNLTIPNSVTAINQYAISNCGALKTIVFSETLTALGNYSICNCANLTSAELPDSLNTIGTYVFQNDRKLVLTEIPHNVETIGNNAFQNCVAITEITFKGTPTSISATAFNGCTGLVIINVPWSDGVVENAPWGATNATINYDREVI